MSHPPRFAPRAHHRRFDLDGLHSAGSKAARWEGESSPDPRQWRSHHDGIQFLESWLGKDKWDVIHFNFGLHDLKLIWDGGQQVSIDDYELNLDGSFCG